MVLRTCGNPVNMQVNNHINIFEQVSQLSITWKQLEKKD